MEELSSEEFSEEFKPKIEGIRVVNDKMMMGLSHNLQLRLKKESNNRFEQGLTFPLEILFQTFPNMEEAKIFLDINLLGKRLDVLHKCLTEEWISHGVTFFPSKI